MKNNRMRYLYMTIALGAAGMLSGQSKQVDLYFEADIQSDTVASVPLDDPRLGQATPVLDEAKAALGWHYAEYTGTVDGFVPDAKIGKDLLPVDDAIIYSRPSSSSPALGVFRPGDDIEIVDTGAWWKIRLTTSFPVYFLLDEPPPLPPVTGAATEQALVEIPEPSPVIEESTLFDETVDAPSTPLRIQGSQPPPIPDDVIGHRYEGVFKQSKRRLGLFAPKAPYYLEVDGERIAWVDPGGVVATGSLKGYLDKPVIIHGERERLTNSTDWIIRARNMRLK